VVAIAGLLLFRGQAYSPSNADAPQRFTAGPKGSFWLISASTLALVLSVLVAMAPVLDTHGQHLATAVHRYAALVFLLSSIVYVGLIRRQA
jgi:hypothetical protein